LPLPLTIPPLHPVLERMPASYERACAWLMTAAIALSLARLGPRLWLGQLGLFKEEPHQH
jgi:hypothetical protein